jgi:hypothetical protein
MKLYRDVKGIYEFNGSYVETSFYRYDNYTFEYYTSSGNGVSNLSICSTSSILYDYYNAQEYTCGGCNTVPPNPVVVAFPKNTYVHINKFYFESGHTYLIEDATTYSAEAITITDLTYYDSCSQSCP